MIAGSIRLPNDARVMLAPKSASTNIPTPTPLSNRGMNIQPKPVSTNPVVIKVVPHGATNGKPNISGSIDCSTVFQYFQIWKRLNVLGQPLVLTAEEFANLTQQSSATKCTVESVSLATQKLVNSVNSRMMNSSDPYSKPATTLSPSIAGPFDGDVSFPFCFKIADTWRNLLIINRWRLWNDNNGW